MAAFGQNMRARLNGIMFPMEHSHITTKTVFFLESLNTNPILGWSLIQTLLLGGLQWTGGEDAKQWMFRKNTDNIQLHLYFFTCVCIEYNKRQIQIYKNTTTSAWTNANKSSEHYYPTLIMMLKKWDMLVSKLEVHKSARSLRLQISDSTNIEIWGKIFRSHK